MEIVKMLPEGKFAELIDDVNYMSSSPNFNRQDLLAEIVIQMKLHIKKNNWVAAFLHPWMCSWTIEMQYNPIYW